MDNDIITSPAYMAVPGNIYHVLVEDDGKHCHRPSRPMTATDLWIGIGIFTTIAIAVAIAAWIDSH